MSQVAEALLNPLGEDDDDFECNFLIDKNIAVSVRCERFLRNRLKPHLQTGMAIVDDTYDVCPQLLPDRFSDPNFQPIYSEDSHKNGTDGALQGSAEGIEYGFSSPSESNLELINVRGIVSKIIRTVIERSFRANRVN